MILWHVYKLLIFYCMLVSKFVLFSGTIILWSEGTKVEETGLRAQWGTQSHCRQTWTILLQAMHSILIELLVGSIDSSKSELQLSYWIIMLLLFFFLQIFLSLLFGSFLGYRVQTISIKWSSFSGDSGIVKGGANIRPSTFVIIYTKDMAAYIIDSPLA